MVVSLGNTSNQPKTPTPNLLTKEIQDLYTRQNFQQLVNYFAAQNQLLNFKFYEINATAASTSVSLNHGLGYVPKDVIITQITGAGEISFDFGNFTSTQIVYSTTGACRCRILVGTYYGDTSTVEAQPTDIQTVTATPATATSTSNTSSTGIVVVNGNYTVLGTEKFIQVSPALYSGAFSSTITLPPVASSAGFSCVIMKMDNSFINIAINVASSDSSALVQPDNVNNTVLSVQYEQVTLMCDGINWYVLDRQYPRGWTSFNMTITADVTNPTRGTGTEFAVWRKNGNCMEMRYQRKQTGSGLAGTGTYSFNLPGGLLIDTSYGLEAWTTNINGSNPPIGVACAATTNVQDTADSSNGSVQAYVNNGVIIVIKTPGTEDARDVVGANYYGFNNPTLSLGFWANIPVMGWRG